MADDVFLLEDGPRALDCLEFDDRLRYVDQVDDACFLAMDLERLGSPALAAQFLQHYAEFSGDDPPAALVHHYIAYRAFVRFKIACLRGDQGVANGEEADSLLRCAVRHSDLAAVSMTLVGGPPGSGKSTLAGQIADRLGMVVLSSDRIRKELAGIDPEASAASPFAAGIYDIPHTERTYEELLARAETLLSLGESVVLDASWSSAEQRAKAREVAVRTHSDLTELSCHCPTATMLDRVVARGRGTHVVSDATAAVTATMAGTRTPWPEGILIDTRRPTAHSVADAVAALGH